MVGSIKYKPATVLNKFTTDCYNKDSNYVKSMPEEREKVMTNKNRLSFMQKDIKLIIQLFTMKYKKEIYLLLNQRWKNLDISNTVSMPKCYCYIFACDGNVLSI